MYNIRKRVFVSFDYDNDRKYKYLLDAWDANPSFEFVFRDMTPGEINSNNIDRIKARLTATINQSTHTLVIVGAHANQVHRLSHEIGFRNWINFEIHQSILNRNKFVAVKLQRYSEIPDELFGVRVSWAYSFTLASIVQALNNAG